jgi:transposase
VYECRRCSVTWDRDKGALYNLAAEYFEKLRKRGNETAEKALASLRRWLSEHPKALER